MVVKWGGGVGFGLAVVNRLYEAREFPLRSNSREGDVFAITFHEIFQ